MTFILVYSDIDPRIHRLEREVEKLAHSMAVLDDRITKIEASVQRRLHAICSVWAGNDNTDLVTSGVVAGTNKTIDARARVRLGHRR